MLSRVIGELSVNLFLGYGLPVSGRIIWNIRNGTYDSIYEYSIDFYEDIYKDIRELGTREKGVGKVKL